jgi:vitamin B12 transporter
MKSPKGFRGKYFSLAAILALSATVTLASATTSYSDSQSSLQQQDEYAQSEEETPAQEETTVVIISKKIKAKKSKVYSASKSIISSTNITDNVNIITSQEMKLQGLTTVAQALETLPGISITRSGGLGESTSLFLQGMSNKYTLVLIDGVRYNDPTNTSGADLSNILIDDIDKIEVIKGAQSGVWGADAAAGVINIITKKATPGTHAKIGIEAGSYKYRSLSTSFSKRTRKYNAMLSILRTTQTGFTAQAPKNSDINQYEKDPYRNTTVNLNVGYWLNSSSHIEFGYHDINSLTNYDTSGPNTQARADYRGKSGYLNYKYYIGRNTVETTFSQSYFHNKQLDATYGINDSIGKIPSLELKDTLKYGHKNSLVFGVNYEKRKVYYTQIGSDEKSKNDTNKALFINNTFHINKLILSQALRYDYFSDFENKLTGKLGAKYLFNKNFNIYVNAGTAYKTPNMMDMINIWGASNFDLKPEKIRTYSIGLNYFGLGINIFRNEIKDMIVWDNAPYPTAKNINISGTSVLKGVEISYQKMLFDKVLLGANYTYLDAKDKDGARLLRRPRYQVGLNVTYWARSDLSISADGAYIGSRADKFYPPYPAQAKDVDTGKYFVLNSKIDFKINKTWDTYLKVNNIFDKKYQSIYGYATPERSFYIGVNAKF